MERLTSDTTVLQRLTQVSLPIGTSAPLLMDRQPYTYIRDQQESISYLAPALANHIGDHRIFH
jgi:hypothetical protein